MMVTKHVLAFSMVRLLAACASQRTDKTLAYSHFEDGDYTDTIGWIRRAESRGDVTPETRAELTCLEAQSLEKLGEYDRAETLYAYLAEQHPASKYGFLAKGKLPALTATARGTQCVPLTSVSTTLR